MAVNSEFSGFVYSGLRFVIKLKYWLFMTTKVVNKRCPGEITNPKSAYSFKTAHTGFKSRMKYS